jgi:hypothetical protein
MWNTRKKYILKQTSAVLCNFLVFFFSAANNVRSRNTVIPIKSCSSNKTLWFELLQFWCTLLHCSLRWLTCKRTPGYNTVQAFLPRIRLLTEMFPSRHKVFNGVYSGEDAPCFSVNRTKPSRIGGISSSDSVWLISLSFYIWLADWLVRYFPIQQLSLKPPYSSGSICDTCFMQQCNMRLVLCLN